LKDQQKTDCTLRLCRMTELTEEKGQAIKVKDQVYVQEVIKRCPDCGRSMSVFVEKFISNCS